MRGEDVIAFNVLIVLLLILMYALIGTLSE